MSSSHVSVAQDFLAHYSLDLSAAVDVYSDWVDACDAVAKDTANQYDGTAGSQPGSSKHDASVEVGRAETYDDEHY